MASLAIDLRDENTDPSSRAMNVKVLKGTNHKKVERKTLQVLQQTPDNRLTRKGEGLLAKSTKVSKIGFSVFKDCSTPKTVAKKECIHASTQTESEGCCACACHIDPVEESAEDEAYRLMGQAEIPEDYWKEIAETRRQALDDSLLENELLNSEVTELKEDNKRLSELAANAEYFANILKELTAEKNGNSSEDNEDSISETVEIKANDEEDRDTEKILNQ